MSKNTQVSAKSIELATISAKLDTIIKAFPETKLICAELLQLSKRVRHHNITDANKAKARQRIETLRAEIAAIQHPTVTPAPEPVKVQIEVKKTTPFGFNPKTGIQHSEEETILYLMREAYKVADQYPVKAQQLCRVALKKYIDIQVIPQCKTPEAVAAAKAKEGRIMEIFTANGFEKREMTLKAAIASYGKQITAVIGEKVLQDAAFRAIEQSQKSFEKEQTASS